MAKAELGLKRSCLSCGMRYYDFNRTPIICPGCQTEFDPELVVRSRRGRVAPKAGGKADNAEDTAAEDTVVSEDNDQTTDEASPSEASEDDAEFEDDDISVGNEDSAGLIADDLDEDDEILPGLPKEDE